MTDKTAQESSEVGLTTPGPRRWLPRLLASDVWHNTDFVRLWVGQTISTFGSQITFLALPLTAVLTLDAPPLQLGILIAVEYVPGLALGLVAGALVDRFSKGRIMVATNLARALLLGLIPVLSATGHLRIGYLYAIGFAVGVFTIAFDVAYISVVPEIVRREQLVEANSNITASQSVAMVAGPPVAGVLVSLFDPPTAIAVDAASFVVAAALFTAMRLTRVAGKAREPAEAEVDTASIFVEIKEGLVVVRRSPTLLAIAGATATLNLFVVMLVALFTLYVTRHLGLSARVLGTIIACFGVGGVVGSVAANRVIARFGIGAASIGAVVVAGAFTFLVPAASVWRSGAIGLLAVSYFVIGVTNPVFGVSMWTIRQAVVPGRLLGRVNAIMRVITTATPPFGALIGGAIAAATGVTTVFVVSACGVLAAGLWLALSPVRAMAGVPEPEERGAG